MSISKAFLVSILLFILLAGLVSKLSSSVALNLGSLALSRVVLQPDISAAEPARQWLEFGIPSSANFRGLTRLFLAQGQTAKSIEAGKQALVLKPGDLMASYWLGQAYWMAGDKDLARSIWHAGGAIQARLDYYNWLCWSLAASGEYEQAEAALREAIDLDPESGSAYDALASLQWGRDWEKVSWALDRAIVYFPEGTAMWRWNEGRRYLMNGDWSAAARSLRAAANLQPTEWSLRFLVDALQRSGDSANAAKAQVELENFLRK